MGCINGIYSCLNWGAFLNMSQTLQRRKVLFKFAFMVGLLWFASFFVTRCCRGRWCRGRAGKMVGGKRSMIGNGVGCYLQLIQIRQGWWTIGPIDKCIEVTKCGCKWHESWLEERGVNKRAEGTNIRISKINLVHNKPWKVRKSRKAGIKKWERRQTKDEGDIPWSCKLDIFSSENANKKK